jgi:lipoprotein-releasing system ATP-binding protein
MIPTLEVKSVEKYFFEPKKVQVLKDISLKIMPGEFVSIMGKSGCGKSTLLYILSTMDTQYNGEVWFQGQNLSGAHPTELARLRNEKIGFVFQFHYLLPEFTVLENVMLPAQKLALLNKEQIKAKALEKLDMLGVVSEANKKATQLSGGQKQRVAIARALINEPAIIMGDEPTGNLDSQNAENVLRIFKSLSANSNQSMLIVTHDEDFAKAGDRTIEMSDGVVVSHDKFGAAGE